MITGEEYAENETMDAMDAVADLPPAEVTTAGNQEAFTEYTAQAIRAIQQEDTARARKKLQDAIDRATVAPCGANRTATDPAGTGSRTARHSSRSTVS